MKVIFSEVQIEQRVREMAEQISRSYGDEPVHVIGILENGFMFLADLARRLTCPVVCEFVTMMTADIQETGHLPLRSIAYGPIRQVKGMHILLVDAIVDSGITLDHLVQQLSLKQPKTLRTAALVDREERRRVPFQVDYVGFPWEGGHLVGYGLEKDGLYRNLPYVADIAAEASS